MVQSAADSKDASQRIRVLVADSTRMNSQLLADALSQDSDLEVSGIEGRTNAVLEAVRHHKPQVLLLSPLPNNGTAAGGFEITREIHALNRDLKVIFLIDNGTPNSVIDAFRSGAQGIFSRNESSKNLAKCIRSVHQGQVWANSAELHYLLQALREGPPIQMVNARGDAILSKREHDVVQCVAEGLTNREIGQRLGLTEHTVKNYLFRVFDKLGVSSRVEVVLYAFRSREFSQNLQGASANKVEADVKAEAPARKSAEGMKPLARRAKI